MRSVLRFCCWHVSNNVGKECETFLRWILLTCGVVYCNYVNVEFLTGKLIFFDTHHSAQSFIYILSGKNIFRKEIGFGLYRSLNMNLATQFVT